MTNQPEDNPKEENFPLLKCNTVLDFTSNLLRCDTCLDLSKDKQFYCGQLSSLNLNKCQDIWVKKNQTLSFGRDSQSSICFSDLYISAHHCQVYSVFVCDNIVSMKDLQSESGPLDFQDAVFVKDLSSNGTFVNGKKIGKNNTQRLVDGDILSLFPPSMNAKFDSISWKFSSFQPREKKSYLSPNLDNFKLKRQRTILITSS